MWVRGHSRSLKMVPCESLGAVSYSPSIVTMALSCISCEIKPDIGRNFFSYPLAFGAPVKRSPSKYCHPVSYGKTRMVGLCDCEKNFEDICNRLDTIPACVRDSAIYLQWSTNRKSYMIYRTTSFSTRLHFKQEIRSVEL